MKHSRSDIHQDCLALSDGKAFNSKVSDNVLFRVVFNAMLGVQSLGLHSPPATHPTAKACACPLHPMECSPTSLVKRVKSDKFWAVN